MTPNRVMSGSAVHSSPSVWPSRSTSRSSNVRRPGSASARKTGAMSSVMPRLYVTDWSHVKAGSSPVAEQGVDLANPIEGDADPLFDGEGMIGRLQLEEGPLPDRPGVDVQSQVERRRIDRREVG